MGGHLNQRLAQVRVGALAGCSRWHALLWMAQLELRVSLWIIGYLWVLNEDLFFGMDAEFVR